MEKTLWHYTCEHTARAIGRSGVLVPNRRAFVPLVWLTDLDAPIRDALGLTSHVSECDRTESRYRVTDAGGVVEWVALRRAFPAPWVDALERAPGAMPRHWYIAADAVPVELADA